MCGKRRRVPLGGLAELVEKLVLGGRGAAIYGSRHDVKRFIEIQRARLEQNEVGEADRPAVRWTLPRAD